MFRLPHFRWIIIDIDTSEEVAAFHDGPEQHDAIKYSPGMIWILYILSYKKLKILANDESSLELLDVELLTRF